MANLKTSQMLRLAQKRLWDGTGEIDKPLRRYVCTALALGVDNMKLDSKSMTRYRELKTRIMSDLDGHSTLPAWLEQKHNIRSLSTGSTDQKSFQLQLQRHRKAWVGLMIAEYTAKGD